MILKLKSSDGCALKKILYKLLGAHINLIIFIGICFSFFGVFFDEKENRNY